MKNKKCSLCGCDLKRDWIALHKKILDVEAKEFYCISCLADTFSCEIDELEVKIEEFKEEGCTLFK